MLYLTVPTIFFVSNGKNHRGDSAGIGIVLGNADFCSTETDFAPWERTVDLQQQKREALVLLLAPRKTIQSTFTHGYHPPWKRPSYLTVPTVLIEWM